MGEAAYLRALAVPILFVTQKFCALELMCYGRFMPLKVRGYASIFGNVDKDGEVVVRGAFSNWIADNPETPVKLFWMHAHQWSPLAKPVGVTTRIKQDRKGLYYEGVIADTPEGLELQELIKTGAVRAASFGFKINDRYQKKETWYLTDLDLIEITAANWGANPKAYIEPVPGEGESE